MNIPSLWSRQPGDFFCISTRSPSGKWTDNFFSREEFKEVRGFIRSHTDSEVYFCPHGFSRRRRLKEYAVLPKLCYADLDEANPRTFELKPTIVLETSPGRYAGFWLTDKPITESLNRRLTYKVRADKGGWDLTQVLRFPGTFNHKYKSEPRVITLWDDGPVYTIRELERSLPEEEVEEYDDDLDFGIVYKKHSRRFDPWLRTAILHARPVEGERSDMMWRMTNTLIEVGVPEEEAFVLLKFSGWNKFRDRRNGDERLREEIDKALGKKLNGHVIKTHGNGRDEDEEFLNKSMAEIEERELDWIWHPYLARGELSILEGDPGLGKSYLAQMIGGHIVDGKTLPIWKPQGKKPVRGRVAYFDMENTADTVTKRRLLDNEVVNLRDYIPEAKTFSIDDPKAMGLIYEALDRVRPALVVFDTVNIYIGKADVHKSTEAQQALAQFRYIATEFNCAVLVLRHLTKASAGVKAIYRGQGSMSIAGLARVIMAVGQMPDDPDTRVLTVSKVNVTKPPKALTFSIHERPHDHSLFEWGEFVDLTEDPQSKREGSIGRVLDGVTDFLKTVLADGPVDGIKIRRMAEKRSFSAKHIQRAADALGINRREEEWKLP